MARFEEADDLYAGLQDFLSPRDAAALYNPDVMGAELGIPSIVRDAMGDSTFGAIPLEGRQGRAEAIAFGQNESMNYYDPGAGQFGQKYRNLASVKGGESVYPDQETFGKFRTPAELSEVPTASSNPDRPRTVAAGYDSERGILTLVFRDGTYYNYYEVTPNQWSLFRGLPTKGPYIASVLDTHPRGEANLSDDSVSSDVRAAVYMVSRIAQVRRGGQVSMGINAPRLPIVRKPANTPRTKPGVNPAQNAGKAPKRKAK